MNEFARQIQEDGYAIVQGLLSEDFMQRCKAELETAIAKETEFHGTEDHPDHGMVLLCSLYGGTFIELFENEGLIAHFNAVMGEGCVVYAYTSSSMPPGSVNYSGRIHVDCPRIIPGYMTNMGATILLDDFTEENGATWFMPNSHLREDEPTREEFEQKAERVIAPAGSVWFFNARTWHLGGNNTTDTWRHALTINMGRPWMKQRIDIPRAMVHMDEDSLPEVARQKLGFLAQVPTSYDEYYVPPEERKFKQETE